VEPARRAKEDQVLSYARWAVALAVTAAAAALPLLSMLLDGAKRWNG
jgi:hypothetical protein